MALLDDKFVLKSLRWLQEHPISIFGADEHHFCLNATLSEAEVVAFEVRHRTRLPEEYRYFLTRIGNGGAGPYYGVFPLGMMDAPIGGGLKPWPEHFVGDLARPFPHSEPWNDVVGMPDLNGDDDEAMDAFDRRYWEKSNLDGAIPICHLGCALRIWLVVSGDEAGHLWYDRRAEYRGLEPVELLPHTRTGFSDWYNEWIGQALENKMAL